MSLEVPEAVDGLLRRSAGDGEKGGGDEDDGEEEMREEKRGGGEDFEVLMRLCWHKGKILGLMGSSLGRRSTKMELFVNSLRSDLFYRVLGYIELDIGPMPFLSPLLSPSTPPLPSSPFVDSLVPSPILGLDLLLKSCMSCRKDAAYGSRARTPVSERDLDTYIKEMEDIGKNRLSWLGTALIVTREEGRFKSYLFVCLIHFVVCLQSLWLMALSCASSSRPSTVCRRRPLSDRFMYLVASRRLLEGGKDDLTSAGRDGRRQWGRSTPTR